MNQGQLAFLIAERDEAQREVDRLWNEYRMAQVHRDYCREAIEREMEVETR